MSPFAPEPVLETVAALWRALGDAAANLSLRDAGQTEHDVRAVRQSAWKLAAECERYGHHGWADGQHWCVVAHGIKSEIENPVNPNRDLRRTLDSARRSIDPLMQAAIIARAEECPA
jgi:hypothetical protein